MTSVDTAYLTCHGCHRWIISLAANYIAYQLPSLPSLQSVACALIVGFILLHYSVLGPLNCVSFYNPSHYLFSHLAPRVSIDKIIPLLISSLLWSFPTFSNCLYYYYLSHLSPSFPPQCDLSSSFLFPKRLPLLVSLFLPLWPIHTIST